MAPMRERFCILHFIYYNDSDGTCVNAHIYIWVTSRRRGNEPGGLDAHVPFFGIKLLIYIYRDSLFGRAKAPYVCMWCQPVTWYTIGWSVLCKCTHARNTKKRPLSPLPPRHVHSSHGLLSRSFVGPLKHPRRQEICHGIYKDVKIFCEALVIKSLTSKS